MPTRTCVTSNLTIPRASRSNVRRYSLGECPETLLQETLLRAVMVIVSEDCVSVKSQLGNSDSTQLDGQPPSSPPSSQVSSSSTTPSPQLGKLQVVRQRSGIESLLPATASVPRSHSSFSSSTTPSPQYGP